MSAEGITPPGVAEGTWEGIGVQKHVEGSNQDEIERSIERAESLGASIKFDIRWNTLYPERDQEIDPQYEQNYKEALAACAKHPSQKPTIILDSPPNWANEQLKENGDKAKLPEEVEKNYRQYCEHVASLIKESGVTPVMIQVMNEVNNTIYNKMSVEQLGHLCRVTRGVFTQKFGEEAPLVMLNILPDVKYLKRLADIKDSVDVIGIDWYRGTYPTEPIGVGLNPLRIPGQIKTSIESVTASTFLGAKPSKTYGNIKTLTDHLDEFLPGGALDGKMVAVAEVGAPTVRGEKDERAQRLFYNQFMRKLNLQLNRYQERGLELPLVGVAFYSLEDEPERPGSEFNTIIAPVQRLLNRLESRWGIFTAAGEAKGNVRDETLTDRIHYLTQERFLRRIKTSERQKEEKEMDHVSYYTGLPGTLYPDSENK